MPQTPKHNSIRDNVLESIKTGRVTMRPRWHFVLRAAFALVGAVFLSLTLLYLASFIVFIVRDNGAWYVPAFGMRGLRIFLLSLPWLLILVALIFVGILEVLVRRYAFAYRRPLLYSAAGVVILVLAGGIAVARTPFHQGFMRRAENRHLPFAGGMYREFGMKKMDSIHKGSISEVNEKGFVVRGRVGDQFTVVFTPHTRLPYGYDFQMGDMVVIFGERVSTTVTAFGMRRIEEGGHMPRGPMMRKMPPPGFYSDP